MHLLLITFHVNGHQQLHRFESAFERGLMMIALASQPVTLQILEG